MAKKQKENGKKSDYTYVEENIYKTNGRFRVRVSAYSCYEDNITNARKSRKRFKKYMKSSTTMFGW